MNSSINYKVNLDPYIRLSAINWRDVTIDSTISIDNILNNFGISSTIGTISGSSLTNITGGATDDFLTTSSTLKNIFGGNGNDILLSNRSGAYLDGGNGDDLLIGSAGNESYMLSSGHDVIYDTGGSNDMLYLRGGVTFADLTFTRDGDDLIVTDTKNGSDVRIVDHFGSGTIETLRFANGETMDMREGFQPVASASAAAVTILASSDTQSSRDLSTAIASTPEARLTAYQWSDVLQGTATLNGAFYAQFGIDKLGGTIASTTSNSVTGGATDDFLMTSGSQKSLFGGNGNDILVSNSANAYLDGGSGDDLLIGGTGNEHYMLSGGHDVIMDSGGANDMLYLRGGVTFNDLTFTRDGEDLIVGDTKNGSDVRIVDHFGTGTIETLHFANGETMDLTNGFQTVVTPSEPTQSDPVETNPVPSNGDQTDNSAALNAATITAQAVTTDWGGVDPNLYRGAGDTDASSLAARTASTASTEAINPNTAHIVDVPLGTTVAQLEAMIANAQSGTTFLMQAGTYVFDDQLDIQRSDITLKGAGDGQTIIQADHVGGDIISVQAAWQKDTFGNIEDSEAKLNTTLVHAASPDATVIQLASVANLNVGDYLEVSQFYNQYRDDAYDDYLGGTVKITAINQQTGEVTLATPIGFNAEAGAKVHGAEFLTNVVLADFTIDYGTPENAVDPYRHENNNPQYIQADGQSDRAIFLSSIADSALYNITIDNAGSRGVVVREASSITVDGLTVDGVQNLGDGGNGYGLEIARTYHSDFVNLTFEGLIRHAVTYSKDGSSAFNNVHILSTTANVDFHGGPDYSNIYYIENADLSQLKDDYTFNVIDYRDENNEGENTVIVKNYIGADATTITKVDPDYVPTNYTGKDVVTAINNYSAVRDDIVYMASSGGSVNTGGGNDVVHTNAGNDLIWVGAGKDTVYFEVGGGKDVIYDLSAKDDHLAIKADLNGSGIKTAADAMQHLYTDASGTLHLDLGNGHDVTFANLHAGDLTAQNFLIV